MSNNINIRCQIGSVVKTNAYGKLPHSPTWLQIEAIEIRMREAGTDVLYGAEGMESLTNDDILELRSNVRQDIFVLENDIPQPLYKVGECVELTESRGYDKIESIYITIARLGHTIEYWMRNRDEPFLEKDIAKSITITAKKLEAVETKNECGAV